MRRAAPVLILLLSLVACGRSSTGSSLDGIKVKGASGAKPTVTFKKPLSVKTTTRRVITTGKGATLAEGAKVRIDYVGIDGKTGKEFDASFGRGLASVTLDKKVVMPGLVKGLLGTKVGSRVVIAVAPAEGFATVGGAQQAGIGADDTVLFIVDVKEIRHPLARATGTPVQPPAGLPTVTEDASGKPTVSIPGTPPPAQLVSQPLIKGEGPEVVRAQSITVHYTGVIWATGKQFDSSWDRGVPADFGIGSGQVIPGWDEGLIGQPVGSRVLLIVPPEKGYGTNGNSAAGISGTDTLVFVVDILDAA